MIAHCSFDLLFSNNLLCWAYFHVPIGVFGYVCLLWINVYLGLRPIFHLGCFFCVIELCELLSCVTELYVFVYFGN